MHLEKLVGIHAQNIIGVLKRNPIASCFNNDNGQRIKLTYTPIDLHTQIDIEYTAAPNIFAAA